MDELYNANSSCLGYSKPIELDCGTALIQCTFWEVRQSETFHVGFGISSPIMPTSLSRHNRPARHVIIHGLFHVRIVMVKDTT